MTDLNPLAVVVLSLTMDPTVSNETIRECFDLVNRGGEDEERVMLRETRISRMRTKGLAALVAMLVLIAGARAAAQTANGVIAGTVADPQGGVLPGVTLTARSADTGAVRTGVTENDGHYRIAGLQPGEYSLRAELEGFGSVELKDVTLTIGLELRRDLTLGLSGVQESVTVRAEALVDTTKSEVAAVVTEQQIDTLPIEGRSAITLSLLLPGTSTDAVRAQRPGATVGLGNLSTAGTNYIVDGMNNMISRAGDAREDVPQSAIQEFKVIVSQAPAEYGGRVGGVVNILTKSGSNNFHGQVFEYFRNKSLNRVDLYTQQNHDLLGNPIPDFRRDQFGGAFGGPIVKNRLQFYASFERTDDQQFFTVKTGKPQYYAPLEGVYQGGSLSNVFFGRTDLQISPTQRAFFRYFRQAETYYSQGSGGTTAAFGSTDTAVPGFSYIAGHTWVISPRLLNEFTVMYAESFQASSLSDRYTPAQYAGVGSTRYVFPSLSWGSSPGTSFRNLYEQFRDSLSLNAGSHSWKFGVGAQLLPTYQTSRGNPNGTWTFGTDQPFNPTDPAFNFGSLQNPTQFTSSFPVIYPQNLSHTYEAYVQDEWKPRPNITLNLGARYDRQTKIFNEDFSQSRYPTPLPYVDFAVRGDPNNLAPRLGVAWDLHNDGKTVLRGGYGIIYVNLQNSLLDGEITAFQQNSVTIRNPSYPDPYQGQDPLTFVSSAPRNITIGANDLRNPRAQTTNAGFTQQLGSYQALHIDAVYSHIDDFPNRVNINTPDPVTGLRPLPEWGQIVQLQPSQGSFDYHALFVRFDRRYSNRYLATISYTLAKQQDGWTGSDANSNGGITDFYHPQWDQGATDTDRRHTLAASGSVLLPFDVTLGGVWTLRSSLPFSALAGKDLNNDGSNNDYVPGTTKNQGNRDLDLALVNAWRAQNGLRPVPASQIDSTRYNRLDVRVSKAIALGGSRKLELIAQVFNLLGVDNLGGIGTGQVTNALSDSFGRVLSALPRQQAELAARFVW